MTSKSYTTFDSSLQWWIDHLDLEEEKEYINGNLIKKTVFSKSPQDDNHRTVARYSSLTGTDPLEEEVSYYGKSYIGGADYTDGRIEWRETPGGERTSYTYTFGAYDPQTNEFTPTLYGKWHATDGQFLEVAITRGTAASPEGIVNKTTRKSRITDKRGHLIRTRTELYIGNGDYEPISETSYNYNSHRQLESVLRDGRIVRKIGWNGYLKAWEEGESGVRTTYLEYDAFGRAVKIRKAGIVTEYVLDALGRILQQIQMPEGSGGEGDPNEAIVILTRQFDVAGHLVSEKDAFNRESTYDEDFVSDHVTVRTTTYADQTGEIVETWADGRIKRVYGDAVHPKEYEITVENETNHYASVRKEVRLGKDSLGNITKSEWIKHYEDMLGRVYKREHPDNAEEYFIYDDRGLLVREIDADGIAKLYGYNVLGELEYTIIDVEGNITSDDWQIGDIEEGMARITRRVSDYLLDDDPENSRGTHIHRTRRIVWPWNNSDFTVLASTLEESIDGLERWETDYDLETYVGVNLPGNGERLITRRHLINSTCTLLIYMHVVMHGSYR